MNRNPVERTFPNGLSMPMNAAGGKASSPVPDVNTGADVTWIHSCVSPDRKQVFCIYDGPSPTAIRLVAERNGLPVDTITAVTVLNPSFYTAD